MPEAIGNVDRDGIRTRTLEIFPNAYMTVVSIIQGGALALLVTRTVASLSTQGLTAPVGGSTGVSGWVLASQVATTWLALVVVFYMYGWYSIVVRYVPTIFDAAIPLALGTAEIFMAASVGEAWWLWPTFATAFTGFVAFSNSLLRATPDMYPAKGPAGPAVWGTLSMTVLATLGMTLVTGVAALLAQILDWRTQATITVGGVSVVGMIIMIGETERRLGGMYASYGWKRHDFDFENLRRVWTYLGGSTTPTPVAEPTAEGSPASRAP